MADQLSLELDPEEARRAAAEAARMAEQRRRLFDNLGRPRWLLWCSDSARMGGRCPRGLDEPRERGLVPACCKQRAARP